MSQNPRVLTVQSPYRGLSSGLLKIKEEIKKVNTYTGTFRRQEPHPLSTK
jgi:hypothetical protein